MNREVPSWEGVWCRSGHLPFSSARRSTNRVAGARLTRGAVIQAFMRATRSRQFLQDQMRDAGIFGSAAPDKHL